MENLKTKECALEWVNAGKPCTYRFGFSYKGAGQRPITTERAKELIAQPGWSFSMGFFELIWEEYNGETVLCFNEYGDNDLW